MRREALNSPVAQGKDEQITYYMDFSAWGASAATPVSSPVVKLYDGDGNDVSATKLSGVASVVGDTKVYFPRVISLEAGVRYRIECQVVCNEDTWEAWSYIDGEQ